MQPDRLTEFSIYVEDRPGELAGVLEACSAAGVDMTSMAVTTNAGKGVIRMLGQPTGALRDALESLVDSGHGPLTETEVLAVSLENRPNAFRDASACFAPHGVNILYAYLAPANNGSSARCILRVDDLDKATDALTSLS